MSTKKDNLKTRITIRMTDTMMSKLESEAAKKKIVVGEVIRRAVAKELGL